MDDYEQVDIMGYDYKPRFETKRVIFESEKIEEVKAALSQTNSNILYFPKALKLKVDPGELGLTKFFENQMIEVWKIN
jgi:hypothetical protein